MRKMAKEATPSSGFASGLLPVVSAKCFRAAIFDVRTMATQTILSIIS